MNYIWLTNARSIPFPHITYGTHWNVIKSVPSHFATTTLLYTGFYGRVLIPQFTSSVLLILAVVTAEVVAEISIGAGILATRLDQLGEAQYCMMHRGSRFC